MSYTYCLMLASVGILIGEVSGSEVCETPQLSVSTKVSLSIQRNKTGHWLAQAQLQTTEDLETTYKESAPFEVELQRSTAACKDSSTTQITVAFTGPPMQQKVPGYELIPGIGSYKFHTNSAVWWEARRICASEGGHLAIINSDAESAALRQLFSRYPKLENVAYNEVAFIGFHDLYVDGEFLTVFDEPLNSTGFMKWDAGEPDNHGGGSGENCGSIFRSGLLNDLLCHLKYAFICEREL